MPASKRPLSEQERNDKEAKRLMKILSNFVLGKIDLPKSEVRRLRAELDKVMPDIPPITRNW